MTRHPPQQTEVLVLGGGPTGLEALLEARSAGYECSLLEAGEIGAAIRHWGHVRLFSPWAINTSRRGRATLEREGERLPPEDETPTGFELIERYLLPLSRCPLLAGRIHTATRALRVGRAGVLKGDLIGNPARAEAPFRVLWRQHGGDEGFTEARILIDATGVLEQPNPAGADGVPALGELLHHDEIVRCIPDLAGRDGNRFRDSVLVIGSGHSAATLIRDLARNGRGPVTWALRSNKRHPLAEIPQDPLPERRRLVRAANAIAEAPPPNVIVERGVSLRALAGAPGGWQVELEKAGDRRALEVAEIVSLTGYRPDLALLSELQVHHCYATDGLMKLSATLLGGGGTTDCLQVETSPATTLINPEPNLFVIGSKSFGRFPFYLMRTGIDQVETIFATLLGKRVAAAERGVR